jgi:hypothetical protein
MLANPAWKLDPVAFIDDDAAKRSRQFSECLSGLRRRCSRRAWEVFSRGSVAELAEHQRIK